MKKWTKSVTDWLAKKKTKHRGGTFIRCNFFVFENALKPKSWNSNKIAPKIIVDKNQTAVFKILSNIKIKQNAKSKPPVSNI